MKFPAASTVAAIDVPTTVTVMLVPDIGLKDDAVAPRTTVPEIVAPPIEPPGAGAGAAGGAAGVGDTGDEDELLFPQALKEIVNAATVNAANIRHIVTSHRVGVTPRRCE